MQIPPEEARDTLAAAGRVVTHTRRSVAATSSAAFLVLWGLIWLGGGLISQFSPDLPLLWVWLGLFVCGGVILALVGCGLVLRGHKIITSLTYGTLAGVVCGEEGVYGST
jgi:hypothetical protein